MTRPALIARSATAGATMAFLTMAYDMMVDPRHPHSLWFFLFSDVLIGIAVAIIVLVYEQRRRRELAAKLAVIAEMNHRVRNALEVIQYSAYATHEKQHIAMIGESVAKIETALNEILPSRKPDTRARSTAAGKEP